MTKLHEAREERSFLEIARSRPVVRRAFRIAMVVGFVLAVINHGNTIISGNMNFEILCKVFVTFLVPYSVSTYSSVLAIRENEPD